MSSSVGVSSSVLFMLLLIIYIMMPMAVYNLIMVCWFVVVLMPRVLRQARASYYGREFLCVCTCKKE
jgi:hypothetical protein